VTKKTEPLKRNILRPERPPWPDDPKSMKLYRRHAEDLDEIWRGHSPVILGTMSQTFDDGDGDESSED